jgi:hypothetical protein
LAYRSREEKRKEKEIYRGIGSCLLNIKMRSVFAFITLLSLLLVLVSISASFSQTFKFIRTQIKSGILLYKMRLISLNCDFWACMQFVGKYVVARKEEVGGYGKKAMDSRPMPEAIQGRIHP